MTRPVDLASIRGIEGLWARSQPGGNMASMQHEDRLLVDLLGLGIGQVLEQLFQVRPGFAAFLDWIETTAGLPDPVRVERFHALLDWRAGTLGRAGPHRCAGSGPAGAGRRRHGVLGRAWLRRGPPGDHARRSRSEARRCCGSTSAPAPTIPPAGMPRPHAGCGFRCARPRNLTWRAVPPGCRRPLPRSGAPATCGAMSTG